MPRAFLIKKRERPTQDGSEGATGVTDPMATTVDEGVEGGKVRHTSGSDISPADVSDSSSPACSPAWRSQDDSEDEIDVESPGIDDDDHLPRASEILERQNLEEQGPLEKVPGSQSSVPSSSVDEPSSRLGQPVVPLHGTLSPLHKSRSSPIPTEVSISPTKASATKKRLSPHCNTAAPHGPAPDVFRRMMYRDGRRVSPPYGLNPWRHGPSPIPPLVPSHSLSFPQSKLFVGQRAGLSERLESSRGGGEQGHHPPSPPKLLSSKQGLAPTSSPAPAPAPASTSIPTTVSCSGSALCVTPISAFRSSPYHEKVMTSGSSPPAVVSHIHPAYPKLHMTQEGVSSSQLAFYPNVRPGYHQPPEENGHSRQVTPPPRSRSPAHLKAASFIKEERERSPPTNDEESRPFSPVSRLYHRKFEQTSPSSKPSSLNAPESLEKKFQPPQAQQPERSTPLFQNGITRPNVGSNSSQRASSISDRGTRLLTSGPRDLSCRPRSPSTVYRERSPLKRNSPDRADSVSRRSESNPSGRRMSPPRPTPHRPSPHVPRSPSRPSVAIPRSRSPLAHHLGVPSSPRRSLGHPNSLPQSLFHPVTVRPTPMIPTSLHLSPRGLPPSPPLAIKERRDSVGVPSPTGSDVSGRHHGNSSSSGRNSTSSQSPLGSPSGSPPEPPRIPDGLAMSWPQGSSAFMGSYPHHSPFLPFNLRLLHGLPAPPPGSRTSFSEASPLPFRPFPELTSSAFKGAPFLPPSPYFPGFRYPMNFSPPGPEAGKAMLDERRVDSLDLSRLGKAPFEGMLKYPSHLEALHTGGKHHPFLPTPAELDAGVGGLLEKKKSKENEPTRFHCDSCKKSYSTFSGLSKHKQYHCASQVKKEFNCKYCDRTYISLGALKMHIRTHTLPCKCKLCGKAFSRPWLLQGHIRTHTGEKPFACPHCARAFADRSNLRAHLQTHSDVKKYSCRGCSKTFSRMSLLVKHEDGCCSPNSIH